ncbi:hypothetical protein [Mangrovicoccus ximenensis]|uniref:hypothetical protein n=1 Tax=Mangrovicoccus ximenensis TaxID=1911570 RepID=UPI0011AE1E16|nr:hypothetical protein [Mangrovicoccus ximenensis]
MSSEAPFRSRIAAAIGIALLSAPALAGDLPVESIGPVFTPVFTPPAAALAPAAGGAQAGTAAGQMAQMSRAADTMRYAARFCGQVGGVYRIDCLSERLAAAAAEMPKTGEYAEAWAAVDSTSKQLEALARDAWDRDKPRITARAADADVQTSRPLRPVQVERMPAVQAEATRILEETETVLLRSAARSVERQALFTEIAQAVDSNKVLLRS